MGAGPFSSDSTTRVDTTSSAFNTGFSEVAGAATSLNVNITGKQKVGKGGTLQPIINLTDQGALAAAAKVSSESLRQVELLGTRLQDSISDALALIASTVKGSTEAVSSANRTETENLGLAALKWGALIAGAFLVARVVTGGARA